MLSARFILIRHLAKYFLDSYPDLSLYFCCAGHMECFMSDFDATRAAVLKGGYANEFAMST